VQRQIHFHSIGVLAAAEQGEVTSDCHQYAKIRGRSFTCSPFATSLVGTSSRRLLRQTAMRLPFHFVGYAGGQAGQSTEPARSCISSSSAMRVRSIFDPTAPTAGGVCRPSNRALQDEPLVWPLRPTVACAVRLYRQQSFNSSFQGRARLLAARPITALLLITGEACMRGST